MQVLRAMIAALIIAVGMVLGIGTPAAHAADLPVEFSSDGVNWQTEPLASVFPHGFVIAPGVSHSSAMSRRATRTSLPASACRASPASVQA